MTAVLNEWAAIGCGGVLIFVIAAFAYMNHRHGEIRRDIVEALAASEGRWVLSENLRSQIHAGPVAFHFAIDDLVHRGTVQMKDAGVHDGQFNPVKSYRLAGYEGTGISGPLNPSRGAI